MKKVTVDPITRLEGHGKIEIFVNDAGEVANVYFQIPELRGFERFCVGRPVEELARITPRICGVCPEAHHMAATKAIDAVYGVTPAPAGVKLRELLYNTFYVTDHATHFYVLAGPDFIMGPTSDPAARNILGVIHKVGLETGGAVIKARAEAAELITMIGGKQIHPVCGLPGGVSKALSAEERDRAVEITAGHVEFAKFSLQLFDDIVLGNNDYVDLIKSDAFTHATYYMGMVDENNHVNFYDGKIRVIGPDGAELVKFEGKDYLEHLAEHVEPYSYLSLPVPQGAWAGRASSTARTRASTAPRRSRASTPPTAWRRRSPRPSTSATSPPWAASPSTPHWRRTGRASSSCSTRPSAPTSWPTDPDITNPDVRTLPTGIVGEGVGVVEAPRGTLYHHYKTDEQGMVTNVNLIVGTTNNNASISMSLKKAAEGLIKGGTEIGEGTLNMIEMAFRAYDPCFGCATHALPGEMPLEVTVKSERTHEVVTTVRRFL